MADPLVTIDTTKVLFGLVAVYTAPSGTAGPADTVAIGTAWSAPWVPIGSTDAGITRTLTRNTVDIRIEEQQLPVARVADTSDLTYSFDLAEDTMENEKLAFGGGTITTTAASTGVIGKKTLVLSETIDQLALGFEGKNSLGFWRRYIVPIVSSTGTVTTTYRRVADKRMLTVTLSAQCKLSDITIAEMTAAAL
jgi:hypothetical protein